MSVQPVFVIGSGRSGTHKIANFFSAFSGIDLHHEYNCIQVQMAAMKYYMHLQSYQDTAKQLRAIYTPAINQSNARVWGDSSNKAAWVIDVLHDIFPEAKFIHVVRDGRKVVSSYFNKLAHECYDDESTNKMRLHVGDPLRFTEPPAEKKYWWPVPRYDHSRFVDFLQYNQFQRMCFHWAEINRIIGRAFAALPSELTYIYKLEELTGDFDTFEQFCQCFGIAADEHVFQAFKMPENVVTPINFSLTDWQLRAFDTIAGDVQRFYGYSERPLYDLCYKQSVAGGVQ